MHHQPPPQEHHGGAEMLLPGGAQYRFESTNFRGHFLQHREDGIWIVADEGHHEYVQSTTFIT